MAQVFSTLTQTWLFQTWLFAIVTQKPSFVLFSRLAFTLFCGHLRSFALICVFLRPTRLERPSLGTSERLGNGNVQANIRTNNSAQLVEGTTHGNMAQTLP